MIDLDQLIPGSAYFRWRDALFLPEWKIYAYPPPEIHKNIIYTAKNVADPIRSLFGKPVQIINWWRPEKYNEHVKGAPGSQHVLGKAIDFSIFTVSLDEIHAVLEPRLAAHSWRMEKPDGKNRVHVDCGTLKPGGSRYFTP